MARETLSQATISARIDASFCSTKLNASARFTRTPPDGDAIDRVLASAALAVSLLLEKPEVYRAVIGSIGAPGPSPGAVRPNSERLWSLALGGFDGIETGAGDLAQRLLPGQLAILFRGCLSFWSAGELADDALHAAVARAAATILLGFVRQERRASLVRRITAPPAT